MFCFRCGFQLPDEALFCMKCGESQVSNKKRESIIYTFELNFSSRSLEANTNDVNEMLKCKDLYSLQGLKFKLEDHLEGQIPFEMKDRRYMYIANFNFFDLKDSIGAFGELLKTNLIISGWKIQPTDKPRRESFQYYLFIKEV